MKKTVFLLGAISIIASSALANLELNQICDGSGNLTDTEVEIAKKFPIGDCNALSKSRGGNLDAVDAIQDGTGVVTLAPIGQPKSTDVQNSKNGIVELVKKYPSLAKKAKDSNKSLLDYLQGDESIELVSKKEELFGKKEYETNANGLTLNILTSNLSVEYGSALTIDLFHSSATNENLTVGFSADEGNITALSPTSLSYEPASNENKNITMTIFVTNSNGDREDQEITINVTKQSLDTRSCKTILDTGGSTGSGVYTIDPDADGPIVAFKAYCDMTTAGGGWTNIGNSFAGYDSLYSSIFNAPESVELQTGTGTSRSFIFKEYYLKRTMAGCTPQSVYTYSLNSNVLNILKSLNSTQLMVEAGLKINHHTEIACGGNLIYTDGSGGTYANWYNSYSKLSGDTTISWKKCTGGQYFHDYYGATEVMGQDIYNMKDINTFSSLPVTGMTLTCTQGSNALIGTLKKLMFR